MDTYLIKFGSGKVRGGNSTGAECGGEGYIQHVTGPHETVQLAQLQEVDGLVGLHGHSLLLPFGATTLNLHMKFYECLLSIFCSLCKRIR